ncbi:hypothetical protein PGT21_004448 [Puccinia graminis f. sp. tritici]|uniref:Uncharacterized protein n=1 Tax=Puccinia graminis f. sp. tritici TaxID=56615 RepID=A0A5B0NML5_PUCGR|nr:hypothetical protein PGT21_004448 [Puccinia graminis f. sp. tritici]
MIIINDHGRYFGGAQLMTGPHDGVWEATSYRISYDGNVPLRCSHHPRADSAFPYNNSISPPSSTPPPLTGIMPPPHPPKPPFRSSTSEVHQTATSLLIWIFRLRHLHSLKESNLNFDLTIFDDGLRRLWTAKRSLNLSATGTGNSTSTSHFHCHSLPAPTHDDHSSNILIPHPHSAKSYATTQSSGPTSPRS